MNKMVIAGGTGYLGNVLVQYFQKSFKEIYVLSRSIKTNMDNCTYLLWDAKNIGPWQEYLDGADVLINLTGKSVDCRYTEKNKSLILDSRVDSTLVLQKAIELCKNPPKVWMNSSTATIYRHSLKDPMDEDEGEIGQGFSVNVAKKWENTFFNTSITGVRKIALRTSIVLGKSGGALPPLLNLVNFGLGDKQGNGQQMFSWIHEQDFARSIDFLLTRPELDGVFNLASPHPCTNETLMKTLRQKRNVPFGIPLSRSILEFGARLIKTETELILKSRYVIPKRLESAGFVFTYPKLDGAISQIIG